jgi:hypothetical protein
VEGEKCPSRIPAKMASNTQKVRFFLIFFKQSVVSNKRLIRSARKIAEILRTRRFCFNGTYLCCYGQTSYRSIRPFLQALH